MASITINSNISALIAERRLGDSTRRLQDSFSRLSSGLRINKAREDAAGLAIASALVTDKRVLSQGIRNLNDGISVTSIADSAIESLSNIVVRLQELAEQAANGTIGQKQRASLDAESQALTNEYFRIARKTEYNGINLFDGSLSKVELQAGYGASGSIVGEVGGAIGTGSFGSRSVFPGGSEPFGIQLADLNGDGKSDIVTTNLDAKSLSVLLGHGDGSFSQAVTYALGLYPYSIALGDLNGDGVMDIVTADSSSSVASVLIGRGDGTFEPRRSYSCAGEPHGVALGDLNGDGVLDLVTSNNPNSVSVFMGSGDGTFANPLSISTGGDPYHLALADFDGDGVLDMAVVTRMDYRLGIFLGNGDGSFSSRISYSAGDIPVSVAAEDLNGDAIVDLAVATTGTDAVSVYMGRGDGSFAPRHIFATGTGPTSVSIGDLNGDGIPDLVASTSGLDVLLGNGNGTFAARISYSTGAAPVSATLADINGDGVLDMAATQRSADTVSIFLAVTTDGVSPLLPFSLKTMAEARQALPMFQQKLDQLSFQRAEIGVFQSRISVAVNNLQVTTENLASAASQITDADMAEESAGLVKNQILQQVGAAILAQANTEPELALSLLDDL